MKKIKLSLFILSLIGSIVSCSAKYKNDIFLSTSSTFDLSSPLIEPSISKSEQSSSAQSYQSYFYDETSLFYSSSEEENHTSVLSSGQQGELPDTESNNQDILVTQKCYEVAERINSSSRNDLYCFFTDPHLFAANNSFEFDDSWFANNLNYLNYICSTSNCWPIICGGDLLNNNDTKEQALFKTHYFVDKMETTFKESYFIVGNHDTNYQGDTYIKNGDISECMLSQEEINGAMFSGNKSYYSYNSEYTCHYCFDSGIDWNNKIITPYRQEQINWFANELLSDTKPHKTILIHMALELNGDNYSITAMVDSICDIINAFNKRQSIIIDNKTFDYSNSVGLIDYIHSGHTHHDGIYSYKNVPIIVTTSFMNNCSFDLVVVDYVDSSINCFRIGDGLDRELNFTLFR